MVDEIRTVLIPTYLEQFSCIGSTCEDTCCVGWRVEVDHTTYKKYEKIQDNEMNTVLNESMKKNLSNPTESYYASISLKPSDNSCPLLNEEKLCSLQLKLGEDYLSDVCVAYPRITNKVNMELEKSASPSCPEAARLILLNPEGIVFKYIEESNEVRNVIVGHLDVNRKKNVRPEMEYFWELRIFTMQVLQNRTYSIADRLIILGMFCRRCDEYVLSSKTDEIPKLITYYTNIIENSSIKESLVNTPSYVAIQIQLVTEFAHFRLTKGVQSERYLESLDEMLNGLQYTSHSTVDEITQQYLEAYHSYYNPFMIGHEYILENYLVNSVYKNLFPLGDKTIFDDYIKLIMHYSMIKLHLIGMAGFHKEKFGVDQVIKLIQSFSKTIEHDAVYISGIIQLLKHNGYDSMAYMTILINN